jgi:hypothetical protein
VAHVLGGHVEDRPTRRSEPVQSTPVGEEGFRLGVMEPVVLDRQPQIRVGEIHSGDEAGVVPHDELGHRGWKSGAEHEQPEARLLLRPGETVRQSGRSSGTRQPRAGLPVGEIGADRGQVHEALAHEVVEQDDCFVT